MARTAIGAVLCALAVAGSSQAAADDLWRPSHFLTTSADDLRATALLDPLDPSRMAESTALALVETARINVAAPLSVTSLAGQPVRDAAMAAIGDGVDAGTPLRPLEPSFSALQGNLTRPCGRASFVAGFGPRTREDGITRHRHPGVTWAVSADTPAAAAARGVVVFAGPIDGLGIVVVLAHDAESHTVYGQLRRTSVDEGQVLERGEWLGDAGALTPDGHRECYFEVRLDGVPVDPSTWFEPR